MRFLVVDREVLHDGHDPVALDPPHDRDREAAPQFVRPPDSEAEEEQGGEGSPNPVSGHVHHAVESEEERGDECSYAKTLVGSFAQRKDAPDKQGDAGNA